MKEKRKVREHYEGMKGECISWPRLGSEKFRSKLQKCITKVRHSETGGPVYERNFLVNLTSFFDVVGTPSHSQGTRAFWLSNGYVVARNESVVKCQSRTLSSCKGIPIPKRWWCILHKYAGCLGIKACYTIMQVPLDIKC